MCDGWKKWDFFLSKTKTDYSVGKHTNAIGI